MKKWFRVFIDILMVALFIILMGYHITGNKVHEILGVITFILFIIHHILNIKWYKTISKGKYNFKRTFILIINTLLFISMLGMMISGIMISATVFEFLNIKTTMFARNLHMISTSWGFVLIAIHLGLHLNTMLLKWNKKMKDNTFEYVYYLLLLLIIIYGIYGFVKAKLWNDMFLISQFKLFDYNQNKILFYLEHLMVVLGIALIVYNIFKFKKGGKKK